MKQKEFWIGTSSGLLLALAFPPFPFFLLSFVGLIPILSTFLSVRKKWLQIYITFFIYHYLTNWWISSWQKDTDPFLFASGFLVAFIHPFFFFVPFAIFYFVSKKIGFQRSLFTFPFIWVAFEWTHSLGDLAYPWLNLGHTQAYNTYFIQIADLGGVWLVSFLICLINVLAYIIILKSKSASLFKNLLKFPETYVIVFLFATIYVYGIFKVIQYDPKSLISNNPTTRFAIVQPNINPWKKWENSAQSQVFIHKKIQDSLFRKVSNIDVVVWSETAITFLDLEINAYHNFSNFYEWVDSFDYSLISGFADFYFLQSHEKPKFTTKYLFGDSTKPYDTYNSILLINSDTTNRYQIYHKIRLTPFGEQIPYSSILGFAKSFLEWNVGISSWAKGEKQIILEAKNSKKTSKIAPIICIESIYPDFVRNSVNLGAETIVIITNDGWYDYTFGPTQHFDIARFRAIENRRFIVRCANTGISGIISPTGQTYYQLPQYTQIASAMDVPNLNDRTIYSFLGDFVPWVSVFVTSVAIGFTIVVRRNANVVAE